ncbi:MAG TPA: Fur family transcriptional regulator [Limnochordales bacterium]
MAPSWDDVATLLQARGLRPTGPRRKLLAFLRSHPGHLTPAEIFEGLRRAGTPLSLATLYQNLAVLSERGIIKRVVSPDGAVRYDVHVEPHHHLICQRCGTIVDVDLAPSATAALQPVPLFASGPPHAPGGPGQLAGWTVLSARVEFHGLCPRCARARRRTLRAGGS